MRPEQVAKGRGTVSNRALAPSEALEILDIVAVAGNLPLALTERNARSDLQDLLLISAKFTISQLTAPI